MALESTIPLEQFTQHFARLGGISFRPALQRCKLAILASIQENFDRGTAPDGTPWPGLKFPRPTTGGSDKPLRDRGLLLASATVSSAEGHIEEITDTTLTEGTNLAHASIHQEGGTMMAKKKFLAIPKTPEARRAGSPRNFQGKLHFRGSDRGGALFDAQGRMQYALTPEVKIPPRPFIGWNRELEQECEDIVVDYVTSQIGGSR